MYYTKLYYVKNIIIYIYIYQINIYRIKEKTTA